MKRREGATNTDPPQPQRKGLAMTNSQNTTTFAREIKSIEVIYTVADRRGDKRVSVSLTGAYTCPCDAFILYGECKHSEAVKAQRKSEGRKF